MTGENDDTGKAAETGRERAMRILIAPLSGLVRPKGTTAKVHAEALDDLARKLSYMDDATLSGLVENVLRQAGRWAKGGPVICPNVGMILAWGYDLQAPPPRQSDYAMTLMRSAMGQRAKDGGWMVELYRTAKRCGPPPGSYLVRDMQTRADDDRRRRLRVSENIEAGRVTPDDMRWLEQYHRDAAEAEALVAGGIAHRENQSIDGSDEVAA
ncbi:MAG: hypothetical protein V4659_03935 [Pseudomonadota bacterium]